MYILLLLRVLSIHVMVLQRVRGVEKKRELQAQLTRVQQQIRDEQARRRKQEWDAQQKVTTDPAFLFK